MSEVIVTCCDFCNKKGITDTAWRRGYTMRPQAVAVEELGWRLIGEAVMCPDCQNDTAPLKVVFVPLPKDAKSEVISCPEFPDN